MFESAKSRAARDRIEYWYNQLELLYSNTFDPCWVEKVKDIDPLAYAEYETALADYWRLHREANNA